MKTKLPHFASAALGALLSLTFALPAPAGPLPVPVERSYDANLVQVAHRRPGFRYWHGHRGYRHYRPGYRRHANGYWFPATAFGAGLLLGGIVVAPRIVGPGVGGHVAWCQNRYRTYRVSDDTFQPNDGPRRRCISPY